MRDLRFDRERILLCHPFKNGLVRATEARKYIPGECVERGLALDDGHLFVVSLACPSQARTEGVLLDNVPAGKDARLMGRLVHARKGNGEAICFGRGRESEDQQRTTTAGGWVTPAVVPTSRGQATRTKDAPWSQLREWTSVL